MDGSGRELQRRRWGWAANGNGRPSTNTALLALAVLLAVPHLVRLCFDFLEPAPPTVCLVNLANNPRTASLFTRGMLEAHGSANTFAVVTPSEGCHPDSERLLLVSNQQLLDWCLGPDVCILTGDEECHAPAAGLQSLHEFLLRSRLFAVAPETAAASRLRNRPSLTQEDRDDRWDEVLDEAADGLVLPDGRGPSIHSDSQLQHLAVQEGINLMRPNVILREFYSSKYEYPSVALGARFEFEPVPEHERDAGDRKYLFNFMGSIKVGEEWDREHLRDVILSHNWTRPIHVRMFDQLVRNPDTSTKEEYRETLLASSFTLAPVGTADDCFRFWEAIEAGSIPVFVRRAGNTHKKNVCPDAFEDVLATNPPIVLLNDWDELPEFAALVTEEQIDDLRRRLVLWARVWWSRTALVVDEAIRRALEARAAAAALPKAELKFRLGEVSAALDALRQQQNINKEARAAEKKKQQAKKQAQAAARRKKKAQQQAKASAQTALRDQLRQHILNELEGSPGLSDQQIQDAVQRIDDVSKSVGYGAATAVQLMLKRQIGETVPVERLQAPTFELLHRLAGRVLERAQYLSGTFDADELDAGSKFMQFPVHRVNFLNKLVRAVAADLGVPPVFVNAQHVVDKTEPERARLLLAFLGRAAAQWRQRRQHEEENAAAAKAKAKATKQGEEAGGGEGGNQDGKNGQTGPVDVRVAAGRGGAGGEVAGPGGVGGGGGGVDDGGGNGHRTHDGATDFLADSWSYNSDGDGESGDDGDESSPGDDGNNDGLYGGGPGDGDGELVP